MPPSRSRVICRAHNHFSPSFVLWQHFVLPNRSYISPSRFSTAVSGTETKKEFQNASPAPHQDLNSPTIPKSSSPQSPKTNNKSGLRITRYLERTNGKRNHMAVHDAELEERPLLEDADRLLATARAAFVESRPYQAVVVRPVVNSRPVKESQLPWSLFRAEMIVTGTDRLAIEMDRFLLYTKPNETEDFARKSVISRLKEIVSRSHSDYVVEVFGSERSGLALATSDIDLRLFQRGRDEDPANAKLPPTREERMNGLEQLNVLRRLFAKDTGYIMPVVRYARYPLLSIQDRFSGLDIQIVLANDTSLSVNLIERYMKEYPYLLKLYCVIKTAMDVRGLSDVFRGGMGSYSLIMMAVASIRHKPHHRQDAAGALLNFLEFWGEFDTETQGVSIEPVCLYDKATNPVLTDTVKSKLEKGESRALPSYMLSLRDPADETNDLGRKAIAIKHIQATFKSLLKDLKTDIKENKRSSLLAPLVGSSYMLNHARRAKLYAFGWNRIERLKVETEKKKEEQEAREKQALASEERNLASQLEAQRLGILEHGEAMASILDMPSVYQEADVDEVGGILTSPAPLDAQESGESQILEEGCVPTATEAMDAVSATEDTYVLNGTSAEDVTGDSKEKSTLNSVGMK